MVMVHNDYCKASYTFVAFGRGVNVLRNVFTTVGAPDPLYMILHKEVGYIWFCRDSLHSGYSIQSMVVLTTSRLLVAVQLSHFSTWLLTSGGFLILFIVHCCDTALILFSAVLELGLASRGRGSGNLSLAPIQDVFHICLAYFSYSFVNLIVLIFHFWQEDIIMFYWKASWIDVTNMEITYKYIRIIMIVVR